jgi:hypothetical protein
MNKKTCAMAFAAAEYRISELPVLNWAQGPGAARPAAPDIPIAPGWYRNY